MQTHLDFHPQAFHRPLRAVDHLLLVRLLPMLPQVLLQVLPEKEDGATADFAGGLAKVERDESPAATWNTRIDLGKL